MEDIKLTDSMYLGNPCKRDHSGLRYKNSGTCVQCAKDRSVSWNKNKNSDRQKICRTYRLKSTYGVTDKQYTEMLNNQNGLCKVCKQTCSKNKYLSVDHCHSTGKVRGLLCHSCNLGLGHLRDDPEIIQRLLDYVREP